MVVTEESSREKYWFVKSNSGVAYPFPTIESAELFAQNCGGEIYEPETD